MTSRHLDLPAAAVTFNESAYLLANPDVARCIETRQQVSGRQHFDLYGCREPPSRMMRMAARIRDIKRCKQQRILSLLRANAPPVGRDLWSRITQDDRLIP